MLSRVANNLFWMDRYMERSYGLLNLIKTNYNSTLDSGDYSSWDNVLKTYMGIEESKSHDDYLDTISIINFMLFDQKNPNTMSNIVIKARENARKKDRSLQDLKDEVEELKRLVKDLVQKEDK